MNTKTEGTLAIIAALLVLFSARWDPRISIAATVLASCPEKKFTTK